LLLSCGSGEIKYTLFDNSVSLDGYWIFRSPKHNVLCYFDLAQNKAFEIPFALAGLDNGMYKMYDFYREDNKNIMVNYTIYNNKLRLQFIEMQTGFNKPINFTIIEEKDIDTISRKGLFDYYGYLEKTREVYYDNLYDDSASRLINIDTFETRELPSRFAYTPRPIDFFENKYLCLGAVGIYYFDEDSIETIEDKDPYIEGSRFQYSELMKKILYNSIVDGVDTIKIFDVLSMEIIDTGIIPMKHDRHATDKKKFYFFGEKYILYARPNEKIFGIKNIFNPVTYILNSSPRL
jgi:hypothetical protein